MFARQSMYLLLISVLFATLLSPQKATAITLQMLLDDMQDTPGIVANRYEQKRIEAELQQLRAETGWSLFGGVDRGRYRELEEAGNREFDGYGGQMGLRYPLLGTLQARRNSVTDARVSLAQAEQMTQLSRSEQRMLLRETYIDWWRLQALDGWCNQHREKSRTEMSVVSSRVSQQQLRLSEKLWTEQRWRSLLVPCNSLQQSMTRMQQRLSYLYGRPLAPDSQPQAQALPLDPAPSQQWLPLLDEHPALLVHQIEQQELEPLTEQRWSDRVDASFSVSQRYDRRSDISGNGSGLVAAITFETPLTGLAGKRENPGVSRQRAAYQRYLDARQTLAQSLELKLQQYRQQLDSIETRRLQIGYTGQLIAEQKARQRIDSASDFMGLRMAHIEQADISLELINDWHAAWMSLAELETLAEQQLPLLSPKRIEWSEPLILDAQDWPQQPIEVGKNEQSTAERDHDAGWRLSAYVWDSSLLLDQQRERHIRQLSEFGFNHVYLGFDAEQVARLEQLLPSIEELVEQLRQQGFTVDLLLGDPHWMLAEHRDGLLQLISKFSALPFDHLHLDLEVEQLGWPVPEERVDDWLQTLAVASQESPWPVTLVSHHRWFAPEVRDSELCIPCSLPEININAATIMLYSTAEDSVIDRTSNIVDAWPELEISLAQSVEADLPQENSWYGASHVELGALSERLRMQLGSRGLAGLAWQDWQQYLQSTESESSAP